MDRTEWLKWRHQGLGSSDAPVVMGRSPYKTRLKLYEEKILAEPEEKQNFITDKGHRLEPIARRKFAAMRALERGVEDPFEPRLFHLSDLPFIKASLDGCSVNGTEFIEIKYVGKAEFENLKEVPERYVDQIQHQFMVSNCAVCHFVLINDIEEVRYFSVYPNEERMLQILAEETVFWNDHVIAKKPPEPSPGDYVEVRFKGAAKLVQEYKLLKRQFEEIEAQLEEARARLLEHVKHPRSTCRGIKIIQVERKGNVDYAKIPELKSVDLERYRKPSSTSWTIRL